MAAFLAFHSDDYSLYSVHNPPAAIANCMSDKNSMSAFPAFPANSNAERHNVSDISRLHTNLVSGFGGEKGDGNIKECPSTFVQANTAIHHCNGSSSSGDLEKKRRLYQNCEETDDHCGLETCDQKHSVQRAAKIKHRRSSACDQDKSYRKSDKECENKKEKVDSPDGLIFVRARRGQATDKHSLAERVRREKINERMRFLQSLVPGCCKATAKAVILDEIINYVKSLQNQVDFLSMKLSAASLPYDFSLEMENYMAKDELVPATESQDALDRYNYIVDIPQPTQYRTAISGTACDDSLTSMTWSTFVGETAVGFMGTNRGNADLQSLVRGGFPDQNQIH